MKLSHFLLVFLAIASSIRAQTIVVGGGSLANAGRVDIRSFGAVSDYSGEISGVVFTNNTTTLTLPAPLATDYTGKRVAIRRGDTSVGATITANLAGSVVSSFNVTAGGQGYITPPTVVAGSPGSGGSFTAVLTDGVVTSITVGAGGTGYTAATPFTLRSVDAGTTNAPFQSELFTVSVQAGTSITLSGTPAFAAPLNGSDAPAVAIFYTDNTAAISNALDYAVARGMEVYVPGGSFVTGPQYLNADQKVTGSGADSRLYFTQGNTFTTFRRSVFSPKNIDFTNGRHSASETLKGVTISDIYIDGNAQWQNPMGPNLNNGSFSLMGINCLAAESWNLSRLTITNCQGDGLYTGSFPPASGLAADYVLVQSRFLHLQNCLVTGNWRNGGQMGNVFRSVWDAMRYVDNSVGYYETMTRRNLTTGSSVGNNNTYSPEEIDFEANSNATSGRNKFVDCYFSTQYGKAIDIFLDQQQTDFLNCTFYNCVQGAVTTSGSVTSGPGNNQDWAGEWTTFNGCRFITTGTNYGAHMIIRHRGYKVVNCYFEGGTGNTSSGAFVVDATSGIVPPRYEMTGILIDGNIFNLKAHTGGAVGTITITPAPPSPINGLVWGVNNIIIEGLVNFLSGGKADEISVAKMAGAMGTEGYAAITGAGANPTFLTRASTAGFGAQEFTVYMKYAPNAASTRNGELFRWNPSSFTEFRIFDQFTAGVSLYRIDWNPNNTGSRTILVPISSYRNAFGAVRLFNRPINLAVTRRVGRVFNTVVTAAGAGYTPSTVLSVTFAGGGGSGAAGQAQTDSAGTVTNVFMTATGTGYTSNPTASIGGGGAGAAFAPSAGRMDVYMDDQIIYSDFGADIITAMSTAAGVFQIQNSAGTQNTPIYEYAVYNKCLDPISLRQLYLYGPAQADRWGTFGSTAGCLTHVKFNPGIGWFFEDRSANALHMWCGQTLVHGTPKRTGQIHRRFVTTGAATNSFNIAVAASASLPANARITSMYAIPSSGTPTIVVGFDAALAEQIVASKVLSASITNYLNLTAITHGTTNRPVYISHSGAATVDYVINYSLDEGGIDGSTIRSGSVVAPAGLGSLSTIAAAAIDATGWTNTFGVNAQVFIEGTGLTFTVYNAAGTAMYTNAATVPFASLQLQPSGKVIVTAGTGVSGRAVVW